MLFCPPRTYYIG